MTISRIPPENIKKASSIQEFIDHIDEFSCQSCWQQESRINKKAKQNASNNDSGQKVTLWYRGHASIEYTLTPSLYRKVGKIIKDKNISIKQIDFGKLLLELEEALMEESRARNFQSIDPITLKDNYLSLAWMQHMEVATRLLDWSEQAFSALFFALFKYFQKNDDVYNECPCVWILNPKNLMDQSISLFQNKDSSISYPDNDLTKEYNISTIFPSLSAGEKYAKLFDYVPMPVISPYNSKRIQSQSGVFVIFPKKFVTRIFPQGKRPYSFFSLEDLNGSGNFLKKIDIIKPEKIFHQFIQLGFKKSLFFPDIPNVSQEIETHYLRDVSA
jgi:hypothetical protein